MSDRRVRAAAAPAAAVAAQPFAATELFAATETSEAAETVETAGAAETIETVEADVLVVGAGAAGLTAALGCAAGRPHAGSRDGSSPGARSSLGPRPPRRGRRGELAAHPRSPGGRCCGRRG